MLLSVVHTEIVFELSPVLFLLASLLLSGIDNQPCNRYGNQGQRNSRIIYLCIILNSDPRRHHCGFALRGAHGPDRLRGLRTAFHRSLDNSSCNIAHWLVSLRWSISLSFQALGRRLHVTMWRFNDTLLCNTAAKVVVSFNTLNTWLRLQPKVSTGVLCIHV